MSSHSKVVGGSTAAMILNCPGSAALIARLPEAVDQPSIYATEGTACHTVIAELVAGESLLDEQLGRIVKTPGEPDIEITRELLRNCIEPAYDFYLNLKREAGEGATGMVEERCDFPGIEGAFGTVDLIIHAPAHRRTYVTDWKFGAGVPVFATYPDPEDDSYESVNPQLMFYTCAARATFPELFPADGEIVLTIVQPFTKDGTSNITQATVTHAELDDFESELADAVAERGHPSARMKMGPWCRFAPCRTICPLQLQPILDIAKLRPEPTAPDYRELLLDVLDVAQIAETVIEEARHQAHLLLESGEELPGWKLVPKRPTRRWAVTPAELVKAMRKLKVKKQALYPVKLVSPAQAEELLPKGTKLPEGLVIKASSGTTLARDEDARAGIPSMGAVAKLLATLKPRA